MLEHRSLKLPILLGVSMIVMLVALIVGWILLTVLGAIRETENAPVYWVMLSVGIVVLAGILFGVVVYLVLSIKAVNLNRRQSNFLDSVTHELKSPIASLKLYLQTLTRHQVNDQERENFHRFMLEDVERLDQLINHLLDAGRSSKTAIDDAVEDLELTSIIAQCVASLCQRDQLDKAVFQIDLRPCVVRARRSDLDMLFRNIIDNAIKYAGDEPQVRISNRFETSDRVSILISDNGRGIPVEERRRVFRRFVRLGIELERDRPGTGLGLYIVHTIVKRLRGRIRILDADTESGAVFEVQLPATITDSEAVASPDHPAHVGAV